MDAIIYSACLCAIAFAAFVSSKYLDRRVTIVFAAITAIYIGVDDLVTGLASSIPDLRLFSGEWNWSGKTYSLLLSIAVIFGFRINARSLGLVLPDRNIAWAAIALVPLTAVGIVLGQVFEPPPPSAETLAFQALMPSLAEEIAYRGIAPALLLGLVGGRNPPHQVPWIVVCAAAIPFSVVHGMSYAGGEFSFDMVPATYTLAGAIVYGWLRFSTGSLLFPLLAHSFANVAFHLTALF